MGLSIYSPIFLSQMDLKELEERYEKVAKELEEIGMLIRRYEVTYNIEKNKMKALVKKKKL
jgi:hypothetical protein